MTGKEQFNPGCKPEVLKLLSYRAYTAKELAVEVNRGRTRVTTLLSQLHEQHIVYVSGWKKSANGKYSPIYSLGNRADAGHPAEKIVRLGPVRSDERKRDHDRLTRNYVNSERVWGI